MVKSLFFVRHAKSDWSIAGQKDFDRDLNSKGFNDAPRMGRKLSEMGVKPDILISSPALRARMTAQYIAEQLKYDLDRIKLDEDIYEASVRSLLSVINKLEDSYNKVMLFGHNPTFTYLAEYLSKKDIGNIPTCGALQIDFEVSSWKEISEGTGTLKWFIYPKKDLE